MHTSQSKTPGLNHVVSKSIDELDSPLGHTPTKIPNNHMETETRGTSYSIDALGDDIEIDPSDIKPVSTAKNTGPGLLPQDNISEIKTGIKKAPTLAAPPAEKKHVKKDPTKEKVEQYLAKIPNLEFVLSHTLVLPNNLFE
jgi:hypothetical protein